MHTPCFDVHLVNSNFMRKLPILLFQNLGLCSKPYRAFLVCTSSLLDFDLKVWWLLDINFPFQWSIKKSRLYIQLMHFSSFVCCNFKQYSYGFRPFKLCIYIIEINLWTLKEAFCNQPCLVVGYLSIWSKLQFTNILHMYNFFA